jgi:hypothetical protein
MLKNPMAKPQIEAVAAQTGMSADTLIRVLEFLVSCAYGYKRTKSFIMHPIVLLSLTILIVSYLLKWFGFQKELLFMMPFK